MYHDLPSQLIAEAYEDHACRDGMFELVGGPAEHAALEAFFRALELPVSSHALSSVKMSRLPAKKTWQRFLFEVVFADTDEMIYFVVPVFPGSSDDPYVVHFVQTYKPGFTDEDHDLLISFLPSAFAAISAVGLAFPDGMSRFYVAKYEVGTVWQLLTLFWEGADLQIVASGGKIDMVHLNVGFETQTIFKVGNQWMLDTFGK